MTRIVLAPLVEIAMPQRPLEPLERVPNLLPQLSVMVHQAFGILVKDGEAHGDVVPVEDMLGFPIIPSISMLSLLPRVPLPKMLFSVLCCALIWHKTRVSTRTSCPRHSAGCVERRTHVQGGTVAISPASLGPSPSSLLLTKSAMGNLTPQCPPHESPSGGTLAYCWSGIALGWHRWHRSCFLHTGIRHGTPVATALLNLGFFAQSPEKIYSRDDTRGTNSGVTATGQC
jgi:hypothetical protein